MSQIRAEELDADLEFLFHDASSLSAIHLTTSDFLNQSPAIDILLLNAGVIAETPQVTQDGLEWTFAINHLAHFLLAITLLPALEKAASTNEGDVRVVCTTSAGFRVHPDSYSLHVSDEELDVSGEGGWW